jgi:hypothetical protein
MVNHKYNLKQMVKSSSIMLNTKIVTAVPRNGKHNNT